jgi:hypothetical protein
MVSVFFCLNISHAFFIFHCIELMTTRGGDEKCSRSKVDGRDIKVWRYAFRQLFAQAITR